MPNEKLKMVFRYRIIYAIAMSTTWNKIHRIKDSGLTWQQFLELIDQHFPSGIDEKTLFKHHRQAHAKPSRHIVEIINHIHELQFPSPFPEDCEALFKLYNSLHKLHHYNGKPQDIEALEFFVDSQIKRETDLLRKARLDWLAGNIAFDRLADARDNGKQQLLATQRDLAIKHYQSAIDVLEQYNHESASSQASKLNSTRVMPFILYKLRQNILACYLNTIHEDQRNDDPDLLQYLRQSDFLQQSKIMLREEPFQWLIARNGLRFSSILQNPENCEFFYNAMVKASKAFADPDYAPLGYSAINDSPSFEWALNHIHQKQN